MTSTGAVLFSLLVAALAPASQAQIVAIEVPFSTRVGEGASGVKRFFRTGCYQVESEGGSGGKKSRDSHAGCHPPGEVSEAFQRLDLLASASGGGIVKEGRVSPADGRGNGSDARAQIRAILVRGDGSRWAAAIDDVASEILGAINGMPGENQWYAKPTGTPVGKGPQFVAVSVSTPAAAGSRRLQASLSIDGRWWCHRSVGAGAGDAVALRAAKLAPIAAGEARARLGRVLQGARLKSAMDDDEDQTDAGGVETSVELIFAGRARSGLFPKRLAKVVAKRFASEMARQSPVCALP